MSNAGTYLMCWAIGSLFGTLIVLTVTQLAKNTRAANESRETRNATQTLITNTTHLLTQVSAAYLPGPAQPVVGGLLSILAALAAYLTL